jgi:hypothetical protein
MESSKDEKKSAVTARFSADALDVTLSSESADVFVKDFPKVLEIIQKNADLVKGVSEKLRGNRCSESCFFQRWSLTRSAG